MAFGQLRSPISVSKSSSYTGSGSRVVTDPTGERRNRQFRQRFHGLQPYRPNPSGESGNICVWMIQDEKIQKETFSPGRAIGDFGTKINLGYLMYLYSDVARKEPETIKNIRNAFSHKLHVRSFNHQLIKDKCQNLTRWEEVHILMTRTGPSNFELRMGRNLLANPDHGGSINFVWSKFPETPRERYIAACKFYIAAFTIQIKEAINHPRPPGYSF
jgi:hypothetical protein